MEKIVKTKGGVLAIEDDLSCINAQSGNANRGVYLSIYNRRTPEEKDTQTTIYLNKKEVIRYAAHLLKLAVEMEADLV